MNVKIEDSSVSEDYMAEESLPESSVSESNVPESHVLEGDAAEDDAHLIAPALARPLLPLIQPVVEDLGFELVRIRITNDAGGLVLQIMASAPDGTMTVDGCERISRHLSAVLDVSDPIKNAYRLEVSSPGLARPLSRPQDFIDWAGCEAKIELSKSVDGQKRFRGILQGFEQNEVLLKTIPANETHPLILGFKLSDIAQSRLIATDKVRDTSLKADLKAKH